MKNMEEKVSIFFPMDDYFYFKVVYFKKQTWTIPYITTTKK